MSRFLRISHTFVAEYQVLFENANIAILSSLLDAAASLNPIVSNFITLHTCICVHWIFGAGAFLLDGGVVWKWDKLKALLKLAALQRMKSETNRKRSCVDSQEKLKCDIWLSPRQQIRQGRRIRNGNSPTLLLWNITDIMNIYWISQKSLT